MREDIFKQWQNLTRGPESQTALMRRKGNYTVTLTQTLTLYVKSRR